MTESIPIEVTRTVKMKAIPMKASRITRTKTSFTKMLPIATIFLLV